MAFTQREIRLISCVVRQYPLEGLMLIPYPVDDGVITFAPVIQEAGKVKNVALVRQEVEEKPQT